MKDMKPYKGKPLWFAISELSLKGSTTSQEICKQFGFDPDMPVGEPLPIKKQEVKEVKHE